ncbi:MAG TPA: NifU N-terminal domain-containing protein [Caldilineaceae bacterium]|nr:NifU N-terminal domain-containing protein [Caldilineaceae bacterium]
MSIRVQQTPNPNARKFILPAHWFDRPVNYGSAASASGEPLAERLFALPGVYNVFTAQDFVTVNKTPHSAWEPLESAILAVLAEYLSQATTARQAPLPGAQPTTS